MTHVCWNEMEYVAAATGCVGVRTVLFAHVFSFFDVGLGERA